MVIIDVREPQEYAGGHVDGAVNVPLMSLAQGATALADIAKDEQIIVYCNSGNRSGQATNALKRQGYTNVINGINQPTVKSHYL